RGPGCGERACEGTRNGKHRGIASLRAEPTEGVMSPGAISLRLLFRVPSHTLLPHPDPYFFSFAATAYSQNPIIISSHVCSPQNTHAFGLGLFGLSAELS